MLLVLLSILLAGCTQMSAEEIAKKIEEKYDAIEDFKGTLKITTEKNGKKVMELEYKYVFKKPNKIRMVSKDVLIVSNGEKMWIYDKKKNEVYIMDGAGKYSQVNPDYGELVKDMLKHYNVKLLGSEKVSGRDCYVVQLTPKNSENVVIIETKMWVDKEFWYPLKIESNMSDVKVTEEYLNVEFNTGVSDDVFQFTPPKGAKVKTDMGIKRFNSVEEAQKHVNFKILKPTYTAGYELKDVCLEFDSVNLMFVKNGKMLMISETKDGVLPEIPNAEKVKVGDCEGLYVDLYGSSMLVFKRGEVMITLCGTIDKEELIKIAESME